MEKLTFTRACLSTIRVIMSIMCVPKGMWVHTVLPYHARHLMLLPSMGSVLPAFPDAENPRVRLLGARVWPRLGYDEGSDWDDGW
jgi:hypothetical protein